METAQQIENIATFLRSVFPHRSLIELRGAPDAGVPSILTSDVMVAAQAAVNMQNELRSSAVWFFGNGVNPGSQYARSTPHDQLHRRSPKTAGNSDANRRTLYAVDCDPKRPSGVCATEMEKAAGLELAHNVKRFFAEKGWPEPVVVDSGNGVQILYRGDGCGPNSNSGGSSLSA